MSCESVQTSDAPVTVNYKPLEVVQELSYLGSLMCTSNAVKDISTRLGKHICFYQIVAYLEDLALSPPTKLRMYNSNAKYVLLYGSECWNVTQTNMRKLDGFQNSYLRRICGIFCPMRMIDDDLYQKTKWDSFKVEIKCSCLKWLGHILRILIQD